MARDVFRLGLAERVEIGQLIRRLSRAERVSWLVWCCQRASRGERQVFLTDAIGTERETWEYWKALCVIWDLDVRSSRAELERRVRIKGTPLLFRATTG